MQVAPQWTAGSNAGGSSHTLTLRARPAATRSLQVVMALVVMLTAVAMTQPGSSTDGQVAHEPAGTTPAAIASSSIEQRVAPGSDPAAQASQSASGADAPGATPGWIASGFRCVAADDVVDFGTASYSAGVEVAWTGGTVTIAERVQVTNASDASICSLDLQVLPNAAAILTFAAVPTRDGDPVSWRWTTSMNLHVKLEPALAPHATTVIALAYRLRVDGVRGPLTTRMGRTNGILALGNVFATLTRAHDYYPIGDPIVSRSAASWDVVVTTDVPMARDAVASSGTLVAGPAAGTSGRAWEFRATNLREFALAISPKFRRAARQVGGTTIAAYTVRMDPAQLLDPGAASFRAFSAWYGPYPRANVSLVEIGASDFSQEYSGLALFSANVADTREVAHEVAHLWWFDLVGNDQQLDPFFDEALAEFSARTFTGAFLPSCSTRPLGLSVFAWRPEPTETARRACSGYSRTIYRRGASFWLRVRTLVGDTAFFGGLRSFVGSHRFDLTGTPELLAAIAKAAPGQVTGLTRLESEYGLPATDATAAGDRSHV